MRSTIVNHFVISIALGIALFPIVTVVFFFVFLKTLCDSCGILGLGGIILIPFVSPLPTFLLSSLIIFKWRTSKENNLSLLKKLFLIFSPAIVTSSIAIFLFEGYITAGNVSTKAIQEASDRTYKNSIKELEDLHLNKVSIRSCTDYVKPVLEGNFSHAEVYINCTMSNQNPGKFYISGNIIHIAKGQRNVFTLYKHIPVSVDGVLMQFVKPRNLNSGQHDIVFSINNLAYGSASYFDLSNVHLDVKGERVGSKTLTNFDYKTKKYDLNNFPYPVVDQQ